MLEHKKIQSLDDYFVELSSRREKGVYFYRINGYSEEVSRFIRKFYEAARVNGVVLEGKIPNPDEKNLAYYNEIMGIDFRMDPSFISASLKKWLPRMTEYQRTTVSGALFEALDLMRRNGKTENMLKNAYIKFMCWLYYKFERIVNQLGENKIPKILYEGEISNYELTLISILSNAGCDVVLLQYKGDQTYLKSDPSSALSYALDISGLGEFPQGFSLKSVRDAIRDEAATERLYGAKPTISNCTNAWINGTGLDILKTDQQLRGSDPGFFYNCFCRMNGAEDKTAYTNDLFTLQQDLKSAGRNLVIINHTIPSPTPVEIGKISRKSYTKIEQMLQDLMSNIRYPQNAELHRIMNKAFLDIILEESRKPNENLNKIMNKCVYLLCWLARYQTQLFPDWRMPQVGCFIYLGGCRNDNEALFLRLLSRLPVDVLILCPDLNTKCCLDDRLLYEMNYSESVNLDIYPEDSSQIRIGTVAYHAERELDELMYRDSGMYRNQQFQKANIISLQTMYEEIKILWNQELVYRPNFSTGEGVVNVPVIFAKISGVKDGDVDVYWYSIKELITEDTFVIKAAPYIPHMALNQYKALAPQFYKNGKLQRNAIKSFPEYPFGILKEETQEMMLDKLETMIHQKLIKGIGENGMEYLVIATVLNLSMDLLRMIQKFDYTKKNPKLIYINTTEAFISPEDSIMTSFLNLIGFDVLFFVPTGYQCVEKHFNKPPMEEHQIGEYKYDLIVPDFNSLRAPKRKKTWREKLFKRGK